MIFPFLLLLNRRREFTICFWILQGATITLWRPSRRKASKAAVPALNHPSNELFFLIFFVFRFRTAADYCFSRSALGIARNLEGLTHVDRGSLFPGRHYFSGPSRHDRILHLQKFQKESGPVHGNASRWF